MQFGNFDGFVESFKFNARERRVAKRTLNTPQ
jgi:hypothetical protein